MDTKSKELSPFSGNFYIVLDTNILINVHRKVFYTLPTLKSIFIENEDKLWIPKHVWNEYLDNWSGTWKNCRKKLEESQSLTITNIDKFKIKNAAGLIDLQKQAEIELHIKSLREEIKTYYANEKKKYSEPQNVKIFEDVQEWLEARIGDGFKVHEIVKILEEGEIRFKNLIPPGFEDTSKDNGNRFGDLLIWKEIISKSKKESADIVFVTEDVKGDWDNPKSRKLLYQEFHEETGRYVQVLKLEDYQNVYNQKPPTKRVSEALAQLDENREKYISSMNELSKNIFAASILDLLKQNNISPANLIKSVVTPDLFKSYSENLIKNISIINPISTSILEKLREMGMNNSYSLPYTEKDFIRLKELLSNLKIEDSNSSSHN